MKKIILILLFFSGLAFPQIVNSIGTYTKTYQISKDTTGHPGLFIGNKPDSSGLALQIYNGGQAGSKSYVPGWQSGSGWKLNYDTTTKEYTLTVDNMTIRGTLAVYEFLINQIRAFNGNFLATASTMVDSLSSFFPTYPYNWIYADSASGNGLAPFQNGDMIMCQEADLSGATYDANGNIVINKYLSKRFIFKVDSVNGLKIYVSTLTGAPANTGKLKKGDIFVRFGNINDVNSGMVGIYSDEQYSPYIRITDSVDSWAKWKSPTSIKMQAGKLTGQSLPNGIPMTGYGLYANRFYLYADSNDYMTFDGNSFKSIIGGLNVGTSLVQNDSLISLKANKTYADSINGKVSTDSARITVNANNISLVSSSVYSVQYSTLDTNWITMATTWSSNGAGLKSTTLDSIFSLRSGININSDSVKLFSSKIIQAQNSIAANTASITLNSNSITSLVSSNGLLKDSVYSYGTKIIQNSNSIALTAASLVTTQGQVHSDSAAIIVNSNNILALVDSVTTHGDSLLSYDSRLNINASGLSLLSTSLTTVKGQVSADSAAILVNANNISLTTSRYMSDSASTSASITLLNTGYITINGNTTFSNSNYNPTTKVPSGGAAADVNANTTTINGGQITTGSITASQIAANTITASQIAVGTITATQIASGTITGTQIAASVSLNSPTITGGRLNGSSFNITTTLTNAIIDSTGIYYADNSSQYSTYITGDKITFSHYGSPDQTISYGAGVISFSSSVSASGYVISGHPINFSDLAGTVSSAQLSLTSSEVTTALGYTPLSSSYVGNSAFQLQNAGGAITSAQTNLSTIAAPSSSAYVTPSVMYGTSGAVLAAPTTWVQIKVGATTYKMPAY